jgi:hypothetical protein
MKYVFIFTAFLLLLGSCTSQPSSATTKVEEQIDSVSSVVTDSSQLEAQKDTGIANAIGEETVTKFVLVADTGSDYTVLRDQMFGLNKKLGTKIDTMGRMYDLQKQRIVEPDTSSDEMYAGEYYPRRETEENLSIEQTNYYLPTASDKCMALVTGIYGSKPEADRALIPLKRLTPGIFIIEARIYMGCMH